MPSVLTNEVFHNKFISRCYIWMWTRHANRNRRHSFSIFMDRIFFIGNFFYGMHYIPLRGVILSHCDKQNVTIKWARKVRFQEKIVSTMNQNHWLWWSNDQSSNSLQSSPLIYIFHPHFCGRPKIGLKLKSAYPMDF